PYCPSANSSNFAKLTMYQFFTVNGYLAALRQRGVDVRVDGDHDHARAIVPDDWNTRTFFADARNHAVLITGLEPEEEDLEAVYHRVINSSAATAAIV
ncbi:MAG: hypothetical protein QGG71_25480, partial [Pirellulaceae bacterium]|nr:hypothetical protein [Pirellulaceae bacterium]